jgi:hypothetical protein
MDVWIIFLKVSELFFSSIGWLADEIDDGFI